MNDETKSTGEVITVEAISADPLISLSGDPVTESDQRTSGPSDDRIPDQRTRRIVLDPKVVAVGRTYQLFHTVERDADLTDVAIDGEGIVTHLIAGTAALAPVAGKSWKDLLGEGLTLTAKTFVTLVVRNTSTEPQAIGATLTIANERDAVAADPQISRSADPGRTSGQPDFRTSGPGLRRGSMDARRAQQTSRRIVGPTPVDPMKQRKRDAARGVFVRSEAKSASTETTAPAGDVSVRIGRWQIPTLLAYLERGSLIRSRDLPAFASALRSRGPLAAREGTNVVIVTMPAELNAAFLRNLQYGGRLEPTQKIALARALRAAPPIRKSADPAIRGSVETQTQISKSA